MQQKRGDRISQMLEQHYKGDSLLLADVAAIVNTPFGPHTIPHRRVLLDSGSVYNYADPSLLRHVRPVTRPITIVGLNGTYTPTQEGLITLRVKVAGVSKIRRMNFWCFALPSSMGSNSSVNLDILLGAKGLDKLGILNMKTSAADADQSLLPRLTDFNPPRKLNDKRKRQRRAATKAHRQQQPKGC